ncbi:sensor histidine kinase [Balneola sp. MJW-20]|uniref:sensor histidine kinase n=1 Tax=Gracilimonas aurantiaca TaxID=3234185 RepID=UPI003467778F
MADSKKKIIDVFPDQSLEVDRRIIYLVLFGIFCGLFIVVLANISVNTAAGMRAYVAGEGFWAKAQKSATLNLSNYIQTEDSAYFNQFRDNIQVNLQDRVAREELSKEDYDYQKAFEAFLGGNNKPDDIPYMIRVYRYYSYLEPVKKVISHWEEGDRLIEDLISFADLIHVEIQDGNLSEEKKSEYLQVLTSKDEEFTLVEAAFSNSIGELARIVQFVLRWSAIVLGVLLLSVGGVFSFRFKRSAKEWMESLKSSQERFMNVINNSPDVLYESRLDDMSYEYVSPSLVDLLGYQPEELAKGGKDFLMDITHPDDIHRLLDEYDMLYEATESGTRSHLEYRVKNASGEYIWLSSLKTLIIDDEGVSKIIGNVREITDQKEQEAQLIRSLEEKEILIKEVHHRVKNNLAIINSMIELQKAKAGNDSMDVLSASQSVINSISKVHEKLYKTTDLDRVEMRAYLTELVEELKEAFRTRQKSIDFELHISELYMKTRPAVSTGLILNELITNAIKYAFSDNKGGTIQINLLTEGDKVRLSVINDGDPIDEEEISNNNDSLGMTMISVLVDRLKGELEILGGDQTEFRITFDISHVIDED